jgi:hypothetical protein
LSLRGKEVRAPRHDTKRLALFPAPARLQSRMRDCYALFYLRQGPGDQESDHPRPAQGHPRTISRQTRFGEPRLPSAPAQVLYPTPENLRFLDSQALAGCGGYVCASRKGSTVTLRAPASSPSESLPPSDPTAFPCSDKRWLLLRRGAAVPYRALRSEGVFFPPSPNCLVRTCHDRKPERALMQCALDPCLLPAWGFCLGPAPWTGLLSRQSMPSSPRRPYRPSTGSSRYVEVPVLHGWDIKSDRGGINVRSMGRSRSTPE